MNVDLSNSKSLPAPGLGALAKIDINSTLPQLIAQLNSLLLAPTMSVDGMLPGPGLFTPTGAGFEWFTNTPPPGFLICDGSALTISDYRALYDVIGTTYGAPSASQFSLPNLKGRVPVGRDSTQAEFDTLGETGGAKTHTLTNSEMPVHSFSMSHHGDENGSVVRGFSGTGGTTSNTWGPNYRGPNGVTGGAGSYYGASITWGANGAHNNLQPYIVLNYIIKT